MALPPSIPTSFVPQSASSAARRFKTDFTGVFGYFAYGVFVIVFVLAIGVFLYGRILASDRYNKDTALAKAEASIDSATVAGFIKLKDRLDSGATLLDNHIALTGFFKVLEELLPTNVRLASIHLSYEGSGKVKFDGSGIAKSFNTLAAASSVFAKDGRIKEAIFSGISINKDSSVSFSLTASIDPKIIAFTP